MPDKSETTTRGRTRRTTFVDERVWTAFGEFKAGITGRKGESAVALALAGLGYSALHDVLLADLFGLTQVDHLARGPDCILVIETKRYGGHITGSLRGDVWVQDLAGGEVRYSFRSPIRQNCRHCRAVEAVLAGLDVPVVGYAVSAGSATFCAELAAVVVPLARLAEMFHAAPPRAYTPAHLEIAWDRLATAAAAAQHRREEHGEAMCRRRDEVDRIEW
jgi:Nuclease-related domain